MKQKVNVVTKKGNRRIGVLNHDTQKIRIAGKLPKPLGYFLKFGEIIYFDKYENGKKIK